MTLFTNGVLGDNLADTLSAIARQESGLLFTWIFIVFTTISSFTLLNMLIGVLCQVIDSCAKEEEKTSRERDFRANLKKAFEALDVSKDQRLCKDEWVII